MLRFNSTRTKAYNAGKLNSCLSRSSVIAFKVSSFLISIILFHCFFFLRFFLSLYLHFFACTFFFTVLSCNRRLHTELVKCGSDVEYVAKVHCLRQAYSKLFTMPGAATWISDIGRQVISDLIVYADKVMYLKLFNLIIVSLPRAVMQKIITIKIVSFI